eukprot:m.255872 g.255872  ORF g.255872 m.255872 type:complete len:120 (+) comp33960_c0_seq1:113-472(+)
MSKSNKKAEVKKFTIDCSTPVDDEILEISHFEDFLKTRIKVEGKTGNLGERVEVKSDGAKIMVSAQAPFSKRYLKYLTKKYLKKKQIRDWLHVIASGPTSYDLRYFNINNEEEEEADEE